MAGKIGFRQQEILRLLLEHKSGKSIDEVAKALNISRNAVQQHITELQREGYIQTGSLIKTAGRPVRKYVLTEQGINSFPKQYAWLTDLLLSDFKKSMGEERLEVLFRGLGQSLADDMMSEFEGKSDDQRLEKLIVVMDKLAYQAKLGLDCNSKEKYMEACNCVYHDIARKHQEVCTFDKVLMQSLLNKPVDLVECMAEGGLLCKFKISKSG